MMRTSNLTHMTTTESDTRQSQLFAALSAFQGEAPSIDKAARGEFNNYADLATVLSAVLPLLAKHGLSLSQGTDRDQGVDVLVTRLMHKDGGMIMDTTRLVEVPPQGRRNNPLHAWGSAQTYQRRYCMLAMLGLAAGIEDDDGKLDMPKATTKAKASKRAPRKAPDAAVSPVVSDALAQARTCRTPAELRALAEKFAKTLSDDHRAEIKPALVRISAELNEAEQRVSPVLAYMADPGTQERAIAILGDLGVVATSAADLMELTDEQVRDFGMEWTIRHGDE